MCKLALVAMSVLKPSTQTCRVPKGPGVFFRGG